jgi:hypothetical protein
LNRRTRAKANVRRLDRQRNGNIPTGLGEQNVSPGQHREQWPQPAMPARDLVHGANEADTMAAVRAEELIGERPGQAAAVRSQDRGEGR